MMKKPWLAALLNIIAGVGYIYLNPKRAFGWLILVSTILLDIVIFDTSPAAQAYNDADPTIWDALSFLGGLTLFVAFILDGYKEALRVNASAKRKKK